MFEQPFLQSKTALLRASRCLHGLAAHVVAVAADSATVWLPWPARLLPLVKVPTMRFHRRPEFFLKQSAVSETAAPSHLQRIPVKLTRSRRGGSSCGILHEKVSVRKHRHVGIE